MKALKRLLYKYLKSRVRKIELVIEKPKQKYNVETFHQLRIEIKKLHAAFVFIDFGSASFKLKKQFRPFQVIFKYAGKIRQIQIEQFVLLKYINKTELSFYRKYLRKKLMQSKYDYFEKLKNKLLIEKLSGFKFKQIISKAINKRNYKQFTNELKKMINKLINKKSLRKNQYHELRKKIKRFNYIKRIFESKYGPDTISPLSKQLGLWHDLSKTQKHLVKYKKNKKLTSMENKQIEKVLPRIELGINKMLLDINKGISKSRGIWTKKENLKLDIEAGAN